MTDHRWDIDEDVDGEIDDLESDLEQSMLDPAFRHSFQDAATRSKLIRILAAQRQAAGLTQAAVAETMRTVQSAISEFEGGASDPRLSTVQRYARAVGAELAIDVIPALVERSAGGLRSHFLRYDLGHDLLDYRTVSVPITETALTEMARAQASLLRRLDTAAINTGSRFVASRARWNVIAHFAPAVVAEDDDEPFEERVAV
jgi:transcriptional regulator with XRE-family HTH domain